MAETGPPAIEIASRPGGIEFTVKVVPGASRTCVAGVWGTALKVTVAAPPEGGKANDAVIELLASVLGVRRADVSILAGHGRPVKRIAALNVTAAAARQRLTTHT